MESENLNIEIQTEKKTFNYGLAFLRMLMCFEVVCCHYWDEDGSSYLWLFSKLKGLAVPVFMFLSFYLMGNTFLTKNNIKIKNRIWRLVYPQIGWAVIYWVVYMLAKIVDENDVRFTDLLWQIFTGHSAKLNAAMWFQTVLIVLTIIYSVIFKFMKKENGMLTIFLILFLALVIQYSGINIKLFDSLRFELKYPIGRFWEMVPYSVLGFLCSYYNIFEKIKTRMFYWFVVFFCVLIFLLKYCIINSAPGFGYSTNNCILLSFFVIGFASLVPFEKCPEKMKSVIKFITKYTLGIYCMHNLVARIIIKIFIRVGIAIDSFVLCIVTYIVCFMASFLMCKIPSKSFNQLVD